MEPLVAAALVGVAVTAATVGFFPRQADALAVRVRSHQPQAPGQKERRGEPSLAVRVLVPALRWLEQRAVALLPSNMVGDLARSLERAGLDMAPASFIVQWVVGMLALPAMVMVVTVVLGLPLTVGAVLAVLAFAPGVVGPIFWLQGRAKRRQQLILRALPDFCDLIAVSVEAGLALEAALARVAEKTPGPLAAEVRKTLHQIALGRSRHDAFADLGQRCGVDELQAFLAAIVQAEQLGVGIAQTLKVQADYLRMRRRQRAETMAQQAPVKMVFPLVFLIFPAMMVVLLGPAVIRLWETFTSGQVRLP